MSPERSCDWTPTSAITRRVLDRVRQRALLDLVLEHETDGEAERGHDERGP